MPSEVFLSYFALEPQRLATPVIEHRSMIKAVVPNLGKSSPRGRRSTRLGTPRLKKVILKRGSSLIHHLKLLNEINLGQKETDNVREMIKIS
jgi:hypothetical protein